MRLLALPAKGETQKVRRLIELADRDARNARKRVRAAAAEPVVASNSPLRKAVRRAAKRMSRAVGEADQLTEVWIDEIEERD